MSELSYKVANKIEDKLVLEIVKNIDIEKIAKELGEHLEKTLIEHAKADIIDCDLGGIITNILEGNSKVAKLFNKKMDNLATAIVDGIEFNGKRPE